MNNEYTHADLVKLAYKWVLANGSCGFAFRELVSQCSEIPDVIGFGSWGHSVLVECKVSRSDFLADSKKPFRVNPKEGMGKQRFYCCPKGLIKVDELPEGWGLLYVSEGKIRAAHTPYKGNIEIRHKGFDKNDFHEMAMMYSALRRLHLRKRIDEIYSQEICNENEQE